MRQAFAVPTEADFAALEPMSEISVKGTIGEVTETILKAAESLKDDDFKESIYVKGTMWLVYNVKVESGPAVVALRYDATDDSIVLGAVHESVDLLKQSLETGTT